MRTEDDARHRPLPGDLYLCHYKTSHTHIQRVVSTGARHIGFESLNFGGRSSGNLHAYWASSGLDDATIAAGGFERWIPAPEVAPEIPARDPATHPQVCDRWAYDAPEGIVDICKHWRILTIAKTAPGGNP